uniref:RNA polymerase I-specific transcription initiation factor RRN3-like n=2 Tax=Hirondellea gigas TaxID=1518452 RepID=A0A2P2HZT0_9CRUS
MLMAGETTSGVLTPILKRHRGDTNSSSEPPSKKLANISSIEEICDVVLERLRVTSLSSTYTSCLQSIKEADAETQAKWLKHLKHRVAVMDKTVSQFVNMCITLPWKLSESAALRQHYQGFMVGLITAQSNCYFKPVLKALFSLMITEASEQDSMLRVNPHAITEGKSCVLHLAIDTIVTVYIKVPMSEDLIMIYANKGMPYFKKHIHVLVVYIKCLLILANRVPSMRSKLLEIVVHVMITIDVNCSRKSLEEEEEDDEEDAESEEVFNMEIDESVSEEFKVESLRMARLRWIFEHPLGHSLDILMDTLMIYIHCISHNTQFTLDYTKDLALLHDIGCVPGSVKLQAKESKKDDSEDEEAMQEDVLNEQGCAKRRELALGCACGGAQHDLPALKLLYVDLRDTFAKVILPTQSSGHVQFFMFYILSLRPGLTSIFLEFLRTKYFLDPSAAVDVRKNAMAYTGSLLVRGKFISFSLVQSCLEVIVTWCHTYIRNQEASQPNNYQSLSLHPVFYCACQTVFYVFSFRNQEFTNSKNTLTLVSLLNLDHLVYSKLNPLAVCLEGIVRNFAAITRHYQLAYCYAIIEANRRANLPISSDGATPGTTIDMFFPYDPYLLQSSARYIEQHYQEFEGLPKYIDTKSDSPNGIAPHRSGSATINQQEPDEEEDDFLDQSASNTSKNNFLEFEFSPGGYTSRRK